MPGPRGGAVEHSAAVSSVVVDRIFLEKLVSELAPAVIGQRIRSVGADADRRGLELTTSAAQGILVSFLPEASGIFRGHLPAVVGAPPRLKKPLVGSRIRALEMAVEDRVVTLRVEQTRLSGRRVDLALRLDVLATRTDLYLLDASGVVLEALSSSRPRLTVGDTYVSLPLPPGASARAASVSTFRERLSTLASKETFTKTDLLFASGMSPLLVDEMRGLIDQGHTPSEAFESLARRLEEGKPRLYLRPRDRDRGKPCVLAPISLAGLSDWESLPFGSFEEGLAAAFELVGSARSMEAARQRLHSALTRALEKSRTLHSKLSEQKSSLEEPAELRKRGEIILAGLRIAKALPDGWVELPDPYDPEAKAIRVRVDPRLSLSANAERYFRRSRKAERTATELGARLAALENEIEYLEGLHLELDDTGTLVEVDALTAEAADHDLLPRVREEGRGRRRAAEVRLPPRRFVTPRGNIVLVGRSGRSNDELTFRLAGPTDLWFHVLGSPGSHVVLKRVGAGEPEESEQLWAAALAAHFSKKRGDAHVDVMVTERRQVHKVKGGPPGLVRVNQSRTLRVAPAKEPQEKRE